MYQELIIFIVCVFILYYSLHSFIKINQQKILKNHPDIFIHQPYDYSKITTTPAPSSNIQINYPSNDIVNNIQTNKKDYINISFKKYNVNDKCKTTSECPDGLSCAFDGTNSYCARQIPTSICTGISCHQSTNDINGDCGGFAINNSVSGNLCKKELSCVSQYNPNDNYSVSYGITNLSNNTYGICTKIL